MTKKEKRRYWDSSCFIALIDQEKDRYETCKAILDAAESGAFVIVSSAAGIAEVLCKKTISTRVVQFLRRSIFKFITLDRILAEEARQIALEFKIKPMDAIHIASAREAGVDVIETFDGKMLALSGRRGIVVREPAIAQQHTLQYPSGSTATEILGLEHESPDGTAADHPPRQDATQE